MVVGWDGCNMAKPASGWRDLGGWVSGRPPAQGETWKEEETMRNRETRTAELRRSLTRNLNYSLRENVSTSIVSSNTRRSFARRFNRLRLETGNNDYNTSPATSSIKCYVANENTLNGVH